MKNKIITTGFIVLSVLISAQIVYATGTTMSKGFGGKIKESPSMEITNDQTDCESGATCGGTCSNTWEDLTSTVCGQGTFFLSPAWPRGTPTEYCVPSTARDYTGQISIGKWILGLYTQPMVTNVGICTCISEVPPAGCVDVTTETVTENLAHVILFGTSR